MMTHKRLPFFCGLFLAALLPSAYAGVTTLYNFTDGVDGAIPESGVIQAANGVFLGTAINGGTNGFGDIFSVTSAGSLTPLYSFTNGVDGAVPWSGLLQVSGGNFFGTTLEGGFGFGTIFEATASGVLTPLYAFTGDADGAAPEGSLTLGPDGALYGTANAGGSEGIGSVFRITTGGAFLPLHSFAETDGDSPATGLTVGPNGNLYGSTAEGGASGFGALFQITTGGQFTPLYSFTGGNDGASPQVALVSATDGNLYGVASSGGTNHNGTLFRMTPAGQFTALYSFSADNSGTNADGINPAALIQASDGNLYGVASFGGQSGAGTIFKATLAGAVTPLYSFGATSTDTHTNTDGSSPSGIIQGRDGNFYGTTLNGGPGALGTIFTFTGPGTAFQFVTPGGIQYANGHATLTLSGLAAQGPVIIDASTDLTHWSPILTNPPASGQIQLTDPAAGSFAYRFYRARLIEP